VTIAAGTSRAPRSRILAIGEQSMLDSSDLDSRTVEIVANMYEAIGEIASSSASEPIEMIVIDERAAGHPLEVIADSIHRLDPGVLVYLVVQNDVDGSARQRALSARFDGVLDAPFSPASAEPGQAPDVRRAPVEDEDEKAVAAAIEVDREFETARDDVAESQMHPGPRAMPAAAEIVARATATAQSGSLGDIDIVEAILDDPEKGIGTALALIAQETGWTGTRFRRAGEASEERPGSESAPVVLRGVTYGVLAADDASRRALEPWASWLARWAALAAAQRELYQTARCDALTGAWNRRYFNEFLPRVLEEARQKRRQIPLMVFDVDNLKVFNDRHGHEAGDTVLRETVRLLRSIIRKGDQVFRIGGDEFVVVFADPDPPRKPGSGVIESVETIARRFQTEICLMKFPKLGPEAPGTLSISAGLATYPWDGTDAETLLRVADQLALDSKRGGKNALTIGPGAAAMCDKTEPLDE